MNIHYNIDKFNGTKPVLTIGTFDGVHRGHKKVLQQLTDAAKEIGGESVVLSFHPHPREIISRYDKKIELLTSLNERKRLLKKAGIDHLIIIPFTKEFADLTYQDFFKSILIDKLNIKKLIVGHDHRFGKDRGGNYEKLVVFGQQNKIVVEKISALNDKNQSISSTKVREALSDGNVELASTFLGYKYRINGRVVKGKQLGRTLGFPTANVCPEVEAKLIPKSGVYVVKVKIDKTSYQGMLNIGNRPTVNNNKQNRTIEVHIFDFDSDIYDIDIELKFISRLRDELKFDSLDSLKTQLAKDKENTIRTLSK